MIKSIHPKKIITNEQFVREPVDNLCKEINKNPSKKIILCGGRGTGKSIVLHNMENKGLGTENQLIYTYFDPIDISSACLFDEEFFYHYYELKFCLKILNYIKRNYELTYENNFKNYETLLGDTTKKTTNYMNNALYATIFNDKVSLDKYLVQAELASEILEKLKKSLNISSLSLAIDRFDWINKNNSLAQNILSTQNTLSKYFDMFDRIIITTDDPTLTDKNNRKKIIEKDYTFIDVNYGKEKDIVKEIIRKRIKEHNMTITSEKNPFPEDIITDNIYQSLVDKTQGNISLIIDILRNIIELWEWKNTDFNLQEAFNTAYSETITYAKRLEKMSYPPRLYL